MIDIDRLKSCMSDVYNADDLYQLKCAVLNFMQEILNFLNPPLDLRCRIYVKDDVDLKELCYYFEEFDDKFINESEFGEFIIVWKDTREVEQEGYIDTIYNWWQDGKLRQ